MAIDNNSNNNRYRSSTRRTGTGTVPTRRKEDNGGVVGDDGTDEPLPPPRRCQYHNDIIMNLPLSPPPQRYTPPLVLTTPTTLNQEVEESNSTEINNEEEEEATVYQNQDLSLRLDEDDDDDEKEDGEEEEESVDEEMTDDDDDDDDGGDYYPSSKTLSGGDEIIIRHHEDECNDGEGRGDDVEEGYSSNNSNKNSNSNNSSNSSNSSNNSTNTLSYRKKGWIGIGLIILFTAAATIGILFWKQMFVLPSQQQHQQDNNSNSNTNNGGDYYGDDDNNGDGSITTTTVVPTPSPTQSFSPTITFPYDSFDDYFNTLLTIVLLNVDNNDSNNNIDPYVWTDPTTSQFDALRFVAYQDGAIRRSSSTGDDYYYGSKEMESKLLQRLGLLVLYYETGGEFYWIQDELQMTTTDNVNVNTDYYNYDNNNKQTDYSDTDTDTTEVELIDWIRPGIDACDWIGITCNEDGYIISLMLRERNIVGNKFIPSETLIWLGPHLEILDLSMNNLRGSIPNDFLFYNNNSNDDNENENENKNENDGITAAVTVSSFLPKLRILDLSKNELDGTIQEDIRYGLPSLQILKLSDNFFNGPLPLYVNTQVLKELYLDSNNFSGTLPFEQWLFASMTLSSTTTTPTTTTASTSTSTIVEEEDDEDNANNEWLSSMEIAMSIDKGETSAEQNNQVKQVGSNDNIMRPTIGSYSNSNSNNNSNNNINNDRSSLKVIDFSNNVLTGTIPRTVAFNNNLEVLALQRNAELTGTIPTEIAVLTSLIQLQLSDCDLDGRLPLEFLLVMPKLERLIVAYNRLTGTIPGDIIFTNYRTINNDNNNDSSNAILYSPLHGFNIGDNRMTGTLPTTLGLLRNLSYLQLFGNEFNGEIPTNYLLRGRHSSTDVNDNNNDSNNNDYDNIQRLWLHDNPNLFGSMPCPTITDDDTNIASLGQQQQQQQQESSSSSLGDGNVADYKAVNNSEEAQQQHESSTIFLDYASDCSSNPNIICPCCNRCF